MSTKVNPYTYNGFVGWGSVSHTIEELRTKVSRYEEALDELAAGRFGSSFEAMEIAKKAREAGFCRPIQRYLR